MKFRVMKTLGIFTDLAMGIGWPLVAYESKRNIKSTIVFSEVAKSLLDATRVQYILIAIMIFGSSENNSEVFS